jgi:energy-coupling factor transporter ATP-binding protein EcfA2
MKFKDIKFGYISAEDEFTYSPELIIDGFLDAYGYIKELLNTEKFLVLGPKGSGKSAIGSKLELISKEEKEIFTKKFVLRNFPYNNFTGIIHSREAPEIQYSKNWEYVLMVACLNSFINDSSFQYPKKGLIILKTLVDSGLLSSEGKIKLDQIVKTTTDKKFEINLKAFKYETSKQEEKITNIDQLFIILEELFYSIKLKSKHYIILDDLDYVFTERENQVKSLSALILAADDMNKRFYQKEIPAKIIIMCRTDLFNKLSGSNKNKIKQQSGIILDWFQETSDLKNTNLAKLINLRTKLSLKTEIDIFQHCLPPELYHRNENKETLHVLFDYTRRTPRDIIQLFNEIQKHTDNSTRPSKENIKYALISYSKNYFIDEIRDELYGFIEDYEINNIIPLLISVGKYRFNEVELKREIQSNDKYKSIDYNKLINALFSCNAVGQIDNFTNFVVFKYRNPYAEYNPKNDILVHNGLQKALNLN